MGNYFYFEICLVAAVVVLFLLVGLKTNRTDLYMKDQNKFEKILITAIIILLSDGISILFEHQNVFFNKFFNTIFYLAFPFINVFYYEYLISKLNINSKHQNINKIILYSIVFINTIIVIVGLFLPKGTYFYINENIEFTLGPIFFMDYIISIVLYGFILINLVFIIKRNREKGIVVKKQFEKNLLIFPLPWICGAILQLFFLEYPISYVSLIFSILLVYINIQSVQISYDAVTGIYNRKQLIPFLTYKLKKMKENNIYIIIIDIDGFKKINDAYGHIIGDDALLRSALIFEKNVNKEDFLARYGGDEFIIIVERKNEYEVMAILENINNDAIKFNEEHKDSYQLSFSAGYTRCSEKYNKIEDFISLADQKMYQNKNR